MADVAAGANTARAIEVEGEEEGSGRGNTLELWQGVSTQEDSQLTRMHRNPVSCVSTTMASMYFPKATDTPRANRRCVGFTKSPSLPKTPATARRRRSIQKVRDTAS